MQSDILLSHSPEGNIHGSVLHEKQDNGNSKALRVFGGEKREKGVIKTEERKEANKIGSLKMETKDKDLLGIVMQLFLTFQDLAVHCHISELPKPFCFSTSVLMHRPFSSLTA